jgi:hypothetical protein
MRSTSAFVSQNSAAFMSSSGKLVKNILGKVVSCCFLVSGFNPGMIGAVMPISLHQFTESKNIYCRKTIV